MENGMGNTMVHAQEGLTGLAGQTGVGTIDFEAPLPYRGKEGEYLEFQNLSVNGDKYPKGFNVKLQSGKDVWSGCSGDWPGEMGKHVLCPERFDGEGLA